MSDNENEVDLEEPVDDLEEDPTSGHAVVTSGSPQDEEYDEDDEANKAVPKEKRITVMSH